ncbi:MAG: ATP-binding protein [Verrucomicrobiota bacterium]
MSTAPTTATPIASSRLPKQKSPISILVIEGKVSTPLGPRIVYANETASRMTGYDLDSLTGSPLGLIYENADLGRLVEKLPAIEEQEGYCWMDRQLLCNGGDRRKARWTIRPTRRETGSRLYHFTLTFTTDLEGEIPSSEEISVPDFGGLDVSGEEGPGFKIESAGRERSEALAMTAGGVAHDFKNALQAIKANLEMAGQVSPRNTKLNTLLDEAGFALHDAEVLARQMLAFTRGESESRTVFEIPELIERVAHLCLAGSHTEARIQVQPVLHAVEGDPNQVYQVLHNLVINACQAMPKGGTVDLTAANVDFEEAENPFRISAGSYVVVSVRDRGCGIPPDVLPKIFEPNFSTKEEGSGFGLASCQSIIHQHGGAIRAASRVGVGTEFLVFLPKTERTLATKRSIAAAETGMPAHEKKVSTASSFAGTLRVLVVEDTPSVSRATCGMLKHLGHDFEVASCGEEAIRAYREAFLSSEPIDVVLLDMTLPGGLDGRDVLHQLLKIDPGSRVIATSGYFEDGPTDALADAGFIGVLAKPYSMDSLKITLSEVAGC